MSLGAAPKIVALFIGFEGEVVAAEPWQPAKTYTRYETVDMMLGRMEPRHRAGRRFVLKRFLYSDYQSKTSDPQPEAAVYEEVR